MEQVRTECRVLLPADPFYEWIWTEGILSAFGRPPLSDEYQCLRSENLFLAAPYVEPVHLNLSRADLIIADITTHDPDVMYQMGYARGVGKRLLLIGKEGARSPFSPDRVPLVTYPSDTEQATLGGFVADLITAVRALPASVHPAELGEMHLALQNQDDSVRQEAAMHLGRARSPRAVPALVGALGDDNANVRASASWALREIADPASVPLLGEMLHDERSAARRAAAWTLREMGGEEACVVLLDGFHDPSAEVRETVAWAFKELDHPDAVPRLIELLDDESQQVRRAAAEALAEKGDARAVPSLNAISQAPDASLRASVAKAIGNSGDMRSIPVLTRFAGDADWSVRQTAARGLGAIGHGDGVAVLETLCGDVHEDVRWAAVEALTQIHTKPARNLISKVAADASQPELVRSIAAAALDKIKAGQ